MRRSSRLASLRAVYLMGSAKRAAGRGTHNGVERILLNKSRLHVVVLVVILRALLYSHHSVYPIFRLNPVLHLSEGLVDVFELYIQDD